MRRLSLVVGCAIGIGGSVWFLSRSSESAPPPKLAQLEARVQAGRGSSTDGRNAHFESGSFARNRSGGHADEEIQRIELQRFPGRDEHGRRVLVRSPSGGSSEHHVALSTNSAPVIVSKGEAVETLPGRRLEVALVDPSGRPLVGEQIALKVLGFDVWLGPKRRLYSAEVSRDGVARIPDLIPTGSWRVSAGLGLEIIDPEIVIGSVDGEIPVSVTIVARRKPCLSGRVFSKSPSPESNWPSPINEVVCANYLPGVPGAGASGSIVSSNVAPDGSFCFSERPKGEGVVRVGCIMPNGGRWWDDRVFAWSQVGLEIFPPLPSSLRIQVYDPAGLPFPRYGIVLGPDSRTPAGAEAILTHEGFHEGGELFLENCESGAHVLRVVPLDLGMAPSRPVRLELAPGDNSMEVHLEEAWELLASVVTRDGTPVRDAVVEVVVGRGRARAADMNYSPVFNGLLIADADRLDGAVRIAKKTTGDQGGAAFLLPSGGEAVAVRVSSNRSAFLPAFVPSVPRRPGRSNVDVVVASGATVRVRAVGARAEFVDGLSLALRRHPSLPGAVNDYPIQWHHRRPAFSNSECVMHNVPHGFWQVDVYMNGLRKQEAVTTWGVVGSHQEFILDVSALGAGARLVKLWFAGPSAQLGAVQMVGQNGTASVLSVKELPSESLSFVAGSGFVRAVVRPAGSRATERWYSLRRFSANEDIDGPVGPHSLSFVASEQHLGKRLSIRGPIDSDVVEFDIESVGNFSLSGVCPFDSQLLLDENVVIEGLELERCILLGQRLQLQ